ncbi:alpha/beta-hydrolase [Zopfia rhizophila CBS 207.26]|uniref:Alpha/beta-hydrolase n=1 Tax=Zopfia rhizophila CBS 207.26 TaxID=1314779 RepID=A0A6A6EHU0_9PEZI|nr:alpha/beta-hydrolase [Zopfia rhizophila CBS 207.26]
MFTEQLSRSTPASEHKLQRKLSVADFPHELDADDQWPYGAPLADVKRLANHWQNSFNWKKAEEELNAFSSFRSKISVDDFGDVDIHFVHQISSNKDAIPLLFCHGWPGSFIEVTKLLPLQGPTDKLPAFHIVAPSLPNFGFSQKIIKPGFALTQYVEARHSLTFSLGYDKYVTQGGDWGFYITRSMGLLYRSHVLTSYISMIRASQPSLTSNPLLAFKHTLTPYSSTEKAGLERSKLEWTDDEILAWVSIYWFFTAGPNAHIRTYYEAVHNPTDLIPRRDRTSKWIPKELSVVPRVWGKTLGPVVYESENKKGGHFAAWEHPDVIAGDLQRMFGKGDLVIIL